MPDWISPPDIFIPEGFSAAMGGHPLVARTLFQRGLTEIGQVEAFLDPAYYQPASSTDLPGLAKAVARLEKAAARGETILVWGDFDVDGQTATTLLVQGLRDLGLRVIYHIPVRAVESHGVSWPVLEHILDGGLGDKPDLVLTCDTGIAAHEPVEKASARGIDFIITDHHELPETLPQAFAIVNPKLLEAGHPLSTLPGVGVAFKLIEEYYARAGRSAESEAYLDLVALGIVADVATQQGDTRYLLQRGLVALRYPQRLGVSTLMEVADLDPTWLTEEHIGFILAPRLNALGRLADANPIVELFTTGNKSQARRLALQLEGLNTRRQLLTSQVYQGALAQIDQDPSLLEYAALVLAHANWPAGVIGIVASRLVEKYRLPVVLIATPPGELGRGSARSVDGVDITAAIAAQRDLLEGFGGHRMAAGMSIDQERIPEFRRGLSRAIEAFGPLPQAVLALDAYLSLAELNLALVEDLERLAPFGPGNPALLLGVRNVMIKNRRAVGRGDEHLLLTLEDEYENSRPVIWWQAGDELRAGRLPEGLIDLAYKVRSSTFRGQRDIQVEWVDYRQQEEDVVQLRSKIEAVDYRQEPHPMRLLQEIAAEGELQVWAEAGARSKLAEFSVPLCTRYDCEACETLVIWTIPAGRSELSKMLEATQPRRVILFASDPGTDRLDEFLNRLGGLLKHVIRERDGKATLGDLAVALAHTTFTVRVGLEWMEAGGHITVLRLDGEVVELGPAGPIAKSPVEQITMRLQALLDETAAFRKYYTRSEPEALLVLE